MKDLKNFVYDKIVNPYKDLEIKDNYVKIDNEIIPYHSIQSLSFSGELLTWVDTNDDYDHHINSLPIIEKRKKSTYDLYQDGYMYCGKYFTSQDYKFNSDAILMYEPVDFDLVYVKHKYGNKLDYKIFYGTPHKQIHIGFLLKANDVSYFLGQNALCTKYKDVMIEKHFLFGLFKVEKEVEVLKDEYKTYFIDQMEAVIQVKETYKKMFDEIESHL